MPAFRPESAGVARPRLAFFRWTRAGLPAFLQAHVQEQRRSLEQFFEVVVIDADCDYDEVCTRIRPDLCLFESGVYAGTRVIYNTATHPGIPKLGFLHADAFDSSRAAFVADMARWDVHWFVTTSMAMAEYTPEIAGRLFVWPNAIDPAVFRDYGLTKNVPVLLTGSQASHYPWRNAVSRALVPEFITMNTPHFGWNSESATGRMLIGEGYSRLLNASSFAPTCGTIAQDVVRKHLEIPASMTCLVTERTASIEAFGFADMVNCVFADENDVVDKLSHLLDNPHELDRITRAGHRLVHDHHTLAHRSQIMQWFELVQSHGTQIEIAQQWPNGALSLAARPRHSPAASRPGRDRQLISNGWSALQRADYATAQREFVRCLSYFFIPEGAIGLTYTSLLQGDWRAAHDWLSRLQIAVLSHHQSAEPDPVHWAFEIRVALCRGDVHSATAAALMYPAMLHPELDRMRAIVATLTGQNRETGPQAGAQRRYSISPVPSLCLADWHEHLLVMLQACGQPDLATRLGLSDSARRSLPAVRRGVTSPRAHHRLAVRMSRLKRGSTLAPVERWLRARLSPYKQRVTGTGWSRYLHGFVQGEPVTRAAILLGSDSWSRSSRAVQRGLLDNPAVTEVSVLDTPRQRPAELVRQHSQEKRLIFVAKSASALIDDIGVLDTATTVILEGTDAPAGYRIFAELTTARGFRIVDQRPEWGGGIVVLRSSPEGYKNRPQSPDQNGPSL
ncbi:glycosyltransferase family 1 protein [Cryobacterium ruanii]|uniref:Glycosyltransferase family 1 protein n=1 Tax=Cryobacterium ruanii TaxID=1259197 RepID=A0A4R9AQT1_9MICO|nr:glycosyltransferase family 1 protein [Cryobacterium ruanii]